MAPPLLRARALAVAAWILMAAPLAAQDMETEARLLGRTLPPGYWDQVAAQPGFFQIQDGWKARTARAMESSVALTGTLPVAVILALFSDSQEPTVSAQEIQAALFDGPSAFGTVTEYYQEVSGGRFTVTGQAIPWP